MNGSKAVHGSARLHYIDWLRVLAIGWCILVRTGWLARSGGSGQSGS